MRKLLDIIFRKLPIGMLKSLMLYRIDVDFFLIRTVSLDENLTNNFLLGYNRNITPGSRVTAQLVKEY